MVIEIKTKVATVIDRLLRIKLFQAFVGYYAMQESNQKTILACVTDLAQFHVLKLRGQSSPLLNVVVSSVNVTTSYTDTLHMLAECLPSEFSKL